MAIAPGAPRIVLIASLAEHPLVGALERRRCAVVQVQTGALAVEWARNFQPDAIMLAADLPDMTGIDASRLLHADLRIGHNVRSEERRVGKACSDGQSWDGHTQAK